MKKLFILIYILLVYSCDCYQTLEVVVYDENTKVPIPNAKINFITFKGGFETDSNGYFENSRTTGFRGINIAKCPDEQAIVSKNGYLSDTIQIECGEPKLIFLKPIE